MSKKKQGVGFRLVKISTEQYAEHLDNYAVGDDDFGIAFNARISIDNTQQVVAVFTKFQFEQLQKPVLVIECGCHFKFEDDFWKASITDTRLTLEQRLLTHLLVLTVGTSRGVLHEKKPKWLDDLILPTINVSDVVKEDFTIDLSIEEEE